MEVITLIVRLYGTIDAPVLDEIVVPLDGSPDAERSLPVAVALSTRLGANLRLLTTKADIGDMSPTAYLDNLALLVPVPVETEVVIDASPDEVVPAATWPDHIGVCMATHARGRVLGALHPHTTESIMQTATGPVFLVGPACDSVDFGDGVVLMAHDGRDDATPVCLALLPVIAKLGHALEVVTVVAAPSGRVGDDPYRETKRAVEPILEAARVAGMTAQHRIVFAKDAVDGIMDEVAATNPLLIVMAAHHHSVVHRLRDGSSTMRVAHRATVPLLVSGCDDERETASHPSLMLL